MPEADPEAQWLGDEADVQLREQGILPFVTDLEVCQRVAANGIAVFRQMSRGIATQMAHQMRENRALKEELENLQGIQRKLVVANKKVAEQTKQLARLPLAEQERDDVRRSAKESEEEVERLRARVEHLTKANVDVEFRYGTATAEGLQRSVGLVAVLAPWVNFEFFTEKYHAREGKICLGDEMGYDPAEDLEVEEEEERSKENAGGGEEAFKDNVEGDNV